MFFQIYNSMKGHNQLFMDSSAGSSEIEEGAEYFKVLFKNLSTIYSLMNCQNLAQASWPAGSILTEIKCIKS